MLALLIAITAWAFIPPVRDSFYAVFTGDNFSSLPAIIFTLAFAALLTAGWFLPSSTVLNISMRVFFWMNFVLPALLIGNVFLENSYGYLKERKQPNPRTELQSVLKPF
jgi:hypothetical protein